MNGTGALTEITRTTPLNSLAFRFGLHCALNSERIRAFFRSYWIEVRQAQRTALPAYRLPVGQNKQAIRLYAYGFKFSLNRTS